MVISDVSSVIYNGNASTTTPYPVNFYFFHDEDLLVTSINTLGTETVLQLDTDYIVIGAGNQDGGSLTTTFEVPVNWKLRIERIIEPTQLTSYQEGDSFPAKSHEQALDKLTFLVQQSLRAGSNGSGGGGGRAWADDVERQLTTPHFIGQLGFQVSTATIYYAQSMSTGDWKTAIFDNTSAALGQVATFSTHTHLTTQAMDGIATLIGGVLGATAKPAGELVGTTEPQTLTNKTLESPVINTPTGLHPVDVGLGNVSNVSDANKPISNATQVALDEKEDKINKGQNGGYAALDPTGKVPLQQLPQSVLGANVYQGTWNAATNTPTIPPATLANTGYYRVVSVAGSTNIDGTSTWAPGDWIISNGTIWQRIVNIDSVSSVNAMTGAVVVTKSHVGLGNVDNTSDATKNSAIATLTNKTLTTPVINSPTGLVKADVGLSAVDNTSDAQKNSASATLTNKTISGASNTLSVRLANDVTGNLPVTNLNGGSGAGTTTFWRGDGSWSAPAGGGDVTGPAGAIDGDPVVFSGSTGKLIRAGSIQIVSLPRNYLAGLTLSNGTDTANDIDIAVGECRDDTNSANMSLSAVMTKRIDAAWTVGTNQGGLDTGTMADLTSYHLFIIRNPMHGTCDALFSTSATAPTMPSGYTQKRRLGGIVRNVGGYGGIPAFKQMGNYFQITAGAAEWSTSFANGQVYVFTLVNIPKGLKLLGSFRATGYCAGGAFAMVVRDPVVTIQYPVMQTNVANNTCAAVFTCWTDTLGQVTHHCTLSTGGNTNWNLQLQGWTDHRGKED